MKKNFDNVNELTNINLLMYIQFLINYNSIQNL